MMKHLPGCFIRGLECGCPQPDLVEDLRFDVYTAWPHSVAVRITHLPTGIQAKARAKDEIQARQEALRKLREALSRT